MGAKIALSGRKLAKAQEWVELGSLNTSLLMLAPWKKIYDKPKQHVKRQRHYFANKDLSSQNYGFASSQCMDVRARL